MTSIMRRTVRGTAAGLGALAIVAGTAACGGLVGGGDEGDSGTETTQEGEDSGTEEDSGDSGSSEDSGDSGDSESSGTDEGTDDSASEDAGSEEGEDTSGDAEDSSDSEEGGDTAAGEALTEEDLTTVGDKYYEFLQAAAEADGEKACALITNPDTDEPLSGADVKLCAEGFEGGAEGSGVDPSMMDAIDRSMIEGVDNGDGTASVTLMGQDGGVTFVNVDGSWYIDGSEFV